MAELPCAIPTPESIRADYDLKRANLDGKLERLKIRISKHEQEFEKLKEQSITLKKPSKELEKKLTAKNGLIQSARQEYERAVAAFYDATVARDKEVERRITEAEDALREIRFEMEGEKRELK
jgi:chromosome segregation ATPase